MECGIFLEKLHQGQSKYLADALHYVMTELLDDELKQSSSV